MHFIENSAKTPWQNNVRKCDNLLGYQVLAQSVLIKKSDRKTDNLLGFQVLTQYVLIKIAFINVTTYYEWQDSTNCPCQTNVWWFVNSLMIVRNRLNVSHSSLGLKKKITLWLKIQTSDWTADRLLTESYPARCQLSENLSIWVFFQIERNFQSEVWIFNSNVFFFETIVPKATSLN